MSPNKEGLKKTEIGLTSASPYAAVGNPVFPYIRSVYGFWALALTSDARASDSSDSRTLDCSDSRISHSPFQHSPFQHSPVFPEISSIRRSSSPGFEPRKTGETTRSPGCSPGSSSPGSSPGFKTRKTGETTRSPGVQPSRGPAVQGSSRPGVQPSRGRNPQNKRNSQPSSSPAVQAPKRTETAYPPSAQSMGVRNEGWHRVLGRVTGCVTRAIMKGL